MFDNFEYKPLVFEKDYWKGYVYIIKCCGFYKIGYSKYKPKIRLSSMQTGNPHKLKLVNEFYCRNTVKAERKLHKTFSHKQTRGEWFKLDKEDLILLDKLISKMREKNISD